jgi:hypothetical protein
MVPSMRLAPTLPRPGIERPVVGIRVSFTFSDASLDTSRAVGADVPELPYSLGRRFLNEGMRSGSTSVTALAPKGRLSKSCAIPGNSRNSLDIPKRLGLTQDTGLLKVFIIGSACASGRTIRLMSTQDARIWTMYRARDRQQAPVIMISGAFRLGAEIYRGSRT